MLGVAVSSSSPSTSPAPPLEPSPGNLEFLKLRDAAATFPFAGSTSSKAECPPRSTDTRRTLTAHTYGTHINTSTASHFPSCSVQQRQKVTPASTHCIFQVHKYTHVRGSLGYQHGPSVLPPCLDPSPSTSLRGPPAHQFVKPDAS